MRKGCNKEKSAQKEEKCAKRGKGERQRKDSEKRILIKACCFLAQIRQKCAISGMLSITPTLYYCKHGSKREHNRRLTRVLRRILTIYCLRYIKHRQTTQTFNAKP